MSDGAAASETAGADVVGAQVYAVLRRRVGPLGYEVGRPTLVCYTHLEDLAADAVDEYAGALFKKAVPDWTSPDGALTPLDMDDAYWAAYVGWDGRVETGDVFEDGITADGSGSGEVGDVGAYVRIYWPSKHESKVDPAGGFTEFYYTEATPYIKEELLVETEAVTQYEDAFKGSSRKPIRGGDMLSGTVGEIARGTRVDSKSGIESSAPTGFNASDFE